MVHISYAAASLLVIASVLGGCFHEESLTVRVFPNRYEVADVSSELATPAVDEVVRRKPASVYLLLCKNTPVERRFQFFKELEARHKVKVTGGFIHDSECR